MGIEIKNNHATVIVHGDYVRGQKIIVGAKSIGIRNGNVIVDGKPLDNLQLTQNDRNVNITIQGDIERLEVDVCDRLEVQGDAGRIKTNAGDVHVSGDCHGDIHANCGNITCGNVDGDIHSNMGTVNYKK